MSLAALARARRAAVAAVAALVIALLPLPGPASAIAPEPKVAVVHSDITSRTFNPDGDPFYPGRVDQTVTILQSEFSNVTKIYDADVADINVLKTYDVVVFPQMLSTTQAQRISIRQYVAGGGAIVASFGLSRWDYQAGRNPEYQSLWLPCGSSATRGTCRGYGSGERSRSSTRSSSTTTRSCTPTITCRATTPRAIPSCR